MNDERRSREGKWMMKMNVERRKVNDEDECREEES